MAFLILMSILAVIKVVFAIAKVSMPVRVKLDVLLFPYSPDLRDFRRQSFRKEVHVISRSLRIVRFIVEILVAIFLLLIGLWVDGNSDGGLWILVGFVCLIGVDTSLFAIIETRVKKSGPLHEEQPKREQA